MKIDVIIPVYMPDDKFERLIDMLNRQTRMPDNIILIWTIPDNNRFDKKQIEDKYQKDNVKCLYVKQKEFDHGATRAYGISVSDADYVLCMTQDAVPYNENLIENLLNAFNDENTAASYARQLPGDKENEIEKITRAFNYPETERIQNKASLKKYGIKTFFCSDVCAMYKKTCYDETGGFIKKTIFNEDMIMASSLVGLGYTVRYVPKAQVVHSHTYTCMQQYRRNFDLAVSQADHPEVFERVPSESEGIRLVIQSAKLLCKKGKVYLLPKLVLQSGFKYLGYRKGKQYKKLSREKILKCTMNKSYWKRIWDEEN